MWSSDFDRVRIYLADMLKAEGYANSPDPTAVKIARTIMEDEYDIAVGPC